MILKGLAFKLLLSGVMLGGVSFASPTGQQPAEPSKLFDPSAYTGPLTVPPLTADQRKAVMDYRREQYKLRQQQKHQAKPRPASSQPAPATSQVTHENKPASTLPTSQPATQPQGRIEKWFDDLGSPQAEVRERARLDLLNLHARDLPALREVVKRSGPASAAQASALRDIVIHVYLSGQDYEMSQPEEGFLGVRLLGVSIGGLDLPQGDLGAGEKIGSGVAVLATLPGFCAFGRLQSGDVIYGADVPQWKPTPEMSELTKVISQTPPGQTIALHIVRQGQIRTISLTLGPRPRITDDITQPQKTQSFIDDRMRSAEQYWNEQFAPLAGRNLS
jgi:hypothetical protein